MEAIDRILLWFGIHTARLRDASDRPATARGSIRRIFGLVGPGWPIDLDGRRGHLTHDGDDIVFVPEVAER